MGDSLALPARVPGDRARSPHLRAADAARLESTPGWSRRSWGCRPRPRRIGPRCVRCSLRRASGVRRSMTRALPLFASDTTCTSCARLTATSADFPALACQPAEPQPDSVAELPLVSSGGCRPVRPERSATFFSQLNKATTRFGAERENGDRRRAGACRGGDASRRRRYQSRRRRGHSTRRRASFAHDTSARLGGGV